MKNNLEQVWKEEARKAYQDQQSQDNEGGCREPFGFVQGYIAAKKLDFEELQKTREQLEKCEKSLMKVACFETHGENKYISHAQAYTGVANFARQYFQDKDDQGEGWMSKLDFFQRLDIYDINGDAVSKKTFNAVKELQEQNKIMREALEFYANGIVQKDDYSEHKSVSTFSFTGVNRKNSGYGETEFAGKDLASEQEEHLQRRENE